MFLTVPVLIYNQLRAADQERQALLLQTAQRQGQAIARALQPVLETVQPSDLPRLSAELARFADEDGRLKLLLRPASVPGPQGFYYVGGAPVAGAAELELERRRLLDQGILQRLAETCSGNQPLAIRVDTPTGDPQILTSLTPINTPLGCWALVTSHSADGLLGATIGRPYWQTPEIQAAALIYMGTAALVLLLFLGVWRNLRRFGELARELGSGDGVVGSFSSRNTLPELAGVAEDFDRLVERLRRSAENLRRAAEDNAHAFKTPIAVIRQSVEPLKRLLPPGEARGHRAVEMIERSIDRLDGLVSFARRMDEAAADLLEPPRRRVDLAALTERLLGGYAGVLEERGARLQARIERGVVVRASDELLETVIENVVENAVSFSPAGGTLAVGLSKDRERGCAVLVVEDEGPGVDPANLERIFERYFSQRGQERAAASAPVAPASGHPLHFGIGLWIVRRNVEAVGGTVRAENREGGGLRMRVELPLAG